MSRTRIKHRKSPPRRHELPLDRLKAILDRAQVGPLAAEDGGRTEAAGPRPQRRQGVRRRREDPRPARPGERLAFHREHSPPVMDELEAWMQALLDKRKVEPNSGLGDAIHYRVKHWSKLTLFLQQPGAPVDNSICDRAIQKAICHRKNSLFCKTLHGAQVGGLLVLLLGFGLLAVRRRR
ncbi:MAG: transposase [Myxococcales bacterium]|nr:transposase [Myxococcales bacterium]